MDFPVLKGASGGCKLISMERVRALDYPWNRQFWAGIVLVGLFWPLNWFLTGLRTAYLFFPLWLGYVLVVDGLVLRRTGSSLLTRSAGRFVLLFLVSAPAWWLFEWINHRTENWEYLGAWNFSGVEYALLCTISFSTVMPAVFESAELVRSFPFVKRFRARGRVCDSRETRLGFLIAGFVMLGLTLLWPRYCYPFVWLSLAFILEAINGTLGRPTLLRHLDRGDWRPAICLALGALLCGVFWEMWNFYSYPKWVYHTPGVEFLHVFEMPILGYLGYIPFAWELHGLWSLATGSEVIEFEG